MPRPQLPPIFFLVLLLLPSFHLAAQYPSASYRTAKTPLLGEFQVASSPSYNPAFLGLGREYLRPDLSRRFYLSIWDMMVSYRAFSTIFPMDTPSFEAAVALRLEDLVLGLSVYFGNISGREQMYRDAETAYINDLNNNVIPPLAAAAITPPIGLSRWGIEGNSNYRNYKNRIEGDATTLLRNIGQVLGEVGLDYLKEQAFFNSDLYIKVFDIEFLLGQQVALGIGVNVRSHVHVKNDLSDFTVDAGRLDLPQMTLAGVSLPTAVNWRDTPVLARASLALALGQATKNYVKNLANSLDQNKLGSLILQSLFEQAYIDLYYVIEPNVRFSFGFPLTEWLYMGHRMQAQILWGLNNLMVAATALDLSDLSKLAKHMGNPNNYKVSVHAGWDLSLVLQPLDWWNFSVMVTDVLGIAPGTTNASSSFWGDLYYPIDLQFGTFFAFNAGVNFRLGFGADIYGFISMLAERQQSFDPNDKFLLLEQFRAKFYFAYVDQFQVTLHYWNRAVGLAVVFDFLTFHPSIGVELDFDLQDIRVRLDILNFTN